MAHGIGCEIYYPVPMHRQECFARLAPNSLPVAERLAGEALSIPVFPELTDAEAGEITAGIAAFFG
jgi:dTDP-4-amino-4,6-dideoxygalactose transaminase